MAQQLFDSRPGKQAPPGLTPAISIHQAATLLDVVDLCRGNPRVVLNLVNAFHPDQDKDETQRPHKPKATSPAGGVRNPPQDRSKDHQRKVLRRIEDRGGASSLAGRKPGGYDAAIPGKHGGLGKTCDQPQEENHAKRSTCSQKAGKAGKQRTDRPYDDANAVDQLRSKTVEHRPRWQLSKHIGPTEPGKQVSQLHRVKRNIPGHCGSGNRERDPVSIAEAAYGEEDSNNEVPHMGLFGLCQVQDLPVISLVSSCISASVKSVSGGRTGPAGRPTAFMPAFTMETA